jgi:hypothetical protein
VQLGLAVHIAEQAAGLDGRGPRLGVHEDPAQPGRVDGQPAVGQSGAGDVVANAAHREHEVVVASEVHCGDDIAGAGRLDDERRRLVDHAVPQRRRLLEALVRGEQQWAAQAPAEHLDRLVGQRARSLIRGGDVHGASVPSAPCSARRNAWGCSMAGSSRAFSITCSGQP